MTAENYSIFIIYLLVFRIGIMATGAFCIFLGYKLFVKGIFPGQAGGPTEGTDADAKIGDVQLKFKNLAPGSFFALLGTALVIWVFIQSPPSLDVTGERQSPQNTPTQYNQPNAQPEQNTADSLHLGQNSTPASSGHNGSNAIAPEALERAVAQVIEANKETFSIKLRGDAEKKAIALAEGWEEYPFLFNLYSKGSIAVDNGQTAEAKRNFRLATMEMAEPINGLAWLYFTQGQYQKALPMAQVATSMVPDEGNFFDTLAQTHYALGNFQEAYKALLKAKEDENFKVNEQLLQQYKAKAGAS